MIFKLRSTLYLLLMSALVVGGAVAQPGGQLGEMDLKAKFANDYNEAKFKDAIADAAALQKLHALDGQTAIITAQAYYKMADYPGCVKYIQDHFNVPKTDNVPSEHKPVIAQLLQRCQKS